MKLFVLAVLLLMPSFSFSSIDNIISDYDFTNQNYNLFNIYSFFSNYKECKLNEWQKYCIYKYSKQYKINALIVITKLEQENNLISESMNYGKLKHRLSRAMGYAVHEGSTIKDKFAYYQHQIHYSVKALRKRFDLWKKGKRILLKCSNKKITPVNASTYSLYIYCPFYGKHNKYGITERGNILFEDRYKRFKKKWLK
jgi:hypothetical protein